MTNDYEAYLVPSISEWRELTHLFEYATNLS
ncbi:hypothetical protein COLO4_02767 [Corchorus olitorius]|uniref:Uncharacterized protein n=1 Tax=Corchorus olitorius TaxID=93759 RepID=A0A1R3L0A4_9ROSI|nr:hypothetical protein COLO4_02767 [Corchorus olitorius]